MQPGSRISHYEILSLIGRGGMGEVWKAHDTKLRRDVALKTLSPEFTSDADRLARLEREAMVLASLSHPNIASIHGLEHEQGAHVLVLELIDGGTLADRLYRGPLTVEQSLKIALQIAEALEAAHERGIVHRDLKPANVAITLDGRVKVLDFGLAKAFGVAGGKASPAVSALRTEIGSVTGTPAYMSPEQARGEVAGRQADIWAAGAILYEMLTGVSPFARDTTAETLACVLDAQPDFNLLPRTLPANVRQLLKRSLEKEPKRRFQDSGDVRIELEDAIAGLASGPQPALVDPAERRGRARRTTALASGMMVIGFLAGYAVWLVGGGAGPNTTAEPVRLSIPSVGSPGSSPVGAHHLALSPDGTRIAYAARDGLSIRRMSDQETVRVDVEAANPFFSTDGEWVGFRDGSRLSKVPRGGGVPTHLAESNERHAGATWGSDDTIVFATTSGLYRIAAQGGPVSALKRPNAEQGERLYAWPSFLANTRTVLFTIVPVDARAAPKIAWLDLDSLETQVLSINGSAPRFVPTGHLLYAAGAALMAVQFDLAARTTRGEPSAIRGVSMAMAADNGAAELAVSATGTLAFIEPSAQQRLTTSLTWVDREGREEPLPLQPGGFLYPRVSPDGTRIAVDLRVADNRDIWIWDLRRSTFARLSDGPSEDMVPLWTSDSRRVFFASDRTGNIDVYSQPADGSTQARVELATPNAEFPNAFTPDGSSIVLIENFNDIGLFQLGRSEAEPLLRRESNDWLADISPDGRWLAYESDEAGPQMEVFLRPFPDVTSRREKLSIDGGRYPLWGPAGSNEIFYVDLDGGMTVVSVETSPELRIGSARKLFDTAKPPLTTNGRPYDLSPLDGRFIMAKSVASLNEQTLNISIVLNWFTELEAQSRAP